MTQTAEIVFSIVIIILTISVWLCGYCFGRADGIKWTRDVYNGKYKIKE